MRVSKLPASQQLVGTVTPALAQPRTLALPLPTVCHLLGMGISCALRDFANLPCHCPITHPWHVHGCRPTCKLYALSGIMRK